MQYCNSCILPDTRPGITIGEDGVCSGCKLSAEKQDAIDWHGREVALVKVFERAKARGAAFDCLIPVSGGKDSIWQVAKALEYGLRPLAVTWKTPGRTDLGDYNLKRLVDLGVNHFDVTVNPDVESKFMYKALERTGSTGVPMHYSIYSIPLRLAVELRIPLVLWGESPFMEYGGDPGDSDTHKLDHRWLETHSILQGTSLEDWVDADLSLKDLELYRLPNEQQFKAADISSFFLGFFLPWDPENSLNEALKQGFKRRAEGPRIGYWDYADIDCSHIAVHHWFKWLKFGCTRLFDNLSLEIRGGRMTRDEALGVLHKFGHQRPTADIQSACDFMNISLDQFHAIEEKFRNTDIWKKVDGFWTLPGFILDDWDWSDPKYGG